MKSRIHCDDSQREAESSSPLNPKRAAPPPPSPPPTPSAARASTSNSYSTNYPSGTISSNQSSQNRPRPPPPRPPPPPPPPTVEQDETYECYEPVHSPALAPEENVAFVETILDENDDDSEEENNPATPNLVVDTRHLTNTGEATATEQQQQSFMMMTPTSINEYGSPRLVFLSDEKAVPEELDRLQEKSIRARQVFLARIHNLECEMASLTAKMALERMERQNQTADMVQSCVHRPLEVGLLEKLHQHRDATTTSSNNSCSNRNHWMELERRLSVLDANMLRSLHVTLQDLKREQLGPLQDHMEQQLLAVDAKERMAQALQNEGTLIRRLECNLAGSLARRYHEERAARVAALAVAALKLNTKNQKEIDTKRADEFIRAIRELRLQVAGERAVRKEQDAKLNERIAQATASLKRSLLDIAAGDDLLSAEEM